VLVVGYGFGGDVRGRAPEYTRYIFAGEKVVSKICRQPERAEDGTYRCADGSEMWLPGRSRADFY
jgi:hypothetical protein